VCDSRPWAARLALQRRDVTHRVDRHFRGQIGGVGVPAPGCHQRVDLDQLATPVQLHRMRISAGVDALTDSRPTPRGVLGSARRPAG
jgi:hypothetical protein